jgi:tetratricopeptide (TPR) repeat protein
MYQKDYILRMIEMFGEFIAAIFGYIKKGNYKQAYESINRAYYDLLKEDASFFQKIPKDEISEKLVSKHNYTNNHLEILAELFYAEAELKYKEGKKDESIELYEKSLILFEFVDNNSRTYSLNRESRQRSIKNRIVKLKD